MLPRILIADDHRLMRSALKDLIEHEARVQVCCEAANGREAVEKAAECLPDVVILDLAMPLMNGLQAARKIHSTLPDVPILLYTVYKFPSLEMEAALCGVTRVIDKGGQVTELLSALEAALRGGEGRRNRAKAAGKM